MVRRMSTTPARILGLEGQGGPVVPGARANLVVFDPGARWTVDPREFASRSRNCPWAGKELMGRVLLTVFQGRVVGRDGQVFTGAPVGMLAS
jgi:dihydroorotase